MSTGNTSGGTPFDPCRQWLGITALELDDPRKLLGLESVDDPIRILQAAEVRLAHLQSVQGGPYEVARRALVARVEEARDRLLSAASTAGLPVGPASPGGLAMPPSPTAASDGLPMPGSFYPPASQSYAPVHPHMPGTESASGSPVYPYPPYHPAGGVPGFPPPVQQPVPDPAYDGIRGTGPIYRRSPGSSPLLLLVGALFTVVTALAIVATQSPPAKTVASRPSVEKPPVSRKPAAMRRPSDGEPRGTPRDRLKGHRPATAATETDMESEMEVADEQTRPSSPENEPAPPDAPSSTTQPGTAPPEPPPPSPRPENSEPTTPAEPPTPPETPTPSEAPIKKPEPPSDEPDVLAKIDDAVKRCFEAVSRREYDAAEREMKAVERIAPEKREANRIAGWLQLVMYAKGFYAYRDQAIAAMKPGDEYDVKSKKIAVVDVTGAAVTVKVAGQQKTWPLDDIPGAVVQAVVESWFDANPANQLYLGAYHFTKPEPDLEQAEACWSKAMIGGADASQLIPLLTDPVVVDAVEP